MSVREFPPLWFDESTDGVVVGVPICLPSVNRDGTWEARCPDCGTPRDFAPRVGFHEAACGCEGMMVRRALHGFVMAPPRATLAPYPDYCAVCGRFVASRLTVYAPVDLAPTERGNVRGFYRCASGHEWTCDWGDRADPSRPTFRSGERTALYRHYDASSVLLYVGITNDLIARGKSHARDSRWTRYAARAEATWFASREEAAFEERRAIQLERPLFNVADSLAHHDERVALVESYIRSRAGGA